MNIKRTLSVSLTLSAAAVLAACSSQPAQQPVTVDVSSSGIPSRKADSQSKILSDTANTKARWKRPNAATTYGRNSFWRRQATVQWRRTCATNG